MVTLTSEQQAKLIFKADHESRRMAKRYCRDHGGEGTAAELDSVLAVASGNPEAVAKAAALAHERAEHEAAFKRAEEWRELEKRAKVIASAVEGDWEFVIDSTAGDIDSGCENEVAENYGSGVSHEDVAKQLQGETGADCIGALDADDVNGSYETLVGCVNSAWDDAMLEEAVKSLRAAATPDGRYAVYECYRKTLSSDGNCEEMCFADLDDAKAWLSLSDYSTSSYSASIIDTQKPDEEPDEEDAD